MSATIWGKFFWSDWRSDPGLRACSYAARGLWMDMLCIAAEAEPKGYISVNGRACDAKAISRVTGGQIEEVAALLAELDEHGVFSKTAEGTIYSRRMVADGEKTKTAVSYGKLGGNRPELPLQPPVGVGGRGGGTPTHQSPDTRSQKPEPRKGEVRASARHRLPPSWSLSDANLSYAAEKGFDERKARQMAEAFVDHHVHKGTVGTDWDRAWNTWCRNEIKFSGRNLGKPPSGPTMYELATRGDK